MTASAAPAERTAPRYGEGREALLAAAVHIGATRGLRHLTHRAVAQEAGVAHGLVAHHFGTRDALLEAALAYSLNNSVASISTRPGSGDLEALFAGVEQMLKDFSDDQVFGFELILESRRRPELRPYVEEMYSAYRKALRDELECAGIACDDSLVHLVFAAVDGMVFQELALGHPDMTQSGLRHLRQLLRSLVSRSGTPVPAGGRGRPKVFDEDMIIFARALHDKGVPVPEIAAKLVIKTGKNAGKHPSVASVYRALADDAAPAAEPAA